MGSPRGNPMLALSNLITFCPQSDFQISLSRQKKKPYFQGFFFKFEVDQLRFTMLVDGTLGMVAAWLNRDYGN